MDLRLFMDCGVAAAVGKREDGSIKYFSISSSRAKSIQVPAPLLQIRVARRVRCKFCLIRVEAHDEDVLVKAQGGRGRRVAARAAGE